MSQNQMIETLELTGADRIERQTIEDRFDLRKTAAFHLLRRLGGALRSFTRHRARLMARLRELQEHPEWRWERERRSAIRARIDDLRPTSRRSLVPTGSTLQKQIDQIAIVGLPDTIQFAPGSLSICCRNMEHLVEQLVLVSKALDTDYQALQQQIESTPTRKPVGLERAVRSALQAG